MTKMPIEAPRKTGKWLRDDVPHTGWRCIEVNDHGAVCEMCEVTEVRYVHVMQHERYPLRLDCGCVCAGFMAEDPATEELREYLYKWRKLQHDNRTPIEKLRRKHWRHVGVPKGCVFGWEFKVGRYYDPSDWMNFHVSISNTDGWRYHLYQPARTKHLTSDPFATDVLAAMAGIERAEMLMANRDGVHLRSGSRRARPPQGQPTSIRH
jgi:hypothetical protein